MNLKFHPVIPFDHNNVLWKLIVCGDNEMLRITVKPVFIGMECGGNQLVVGAGSLNLSVGKRFM